MVWATGGAAQTLPPPSASQVTPRTIAPPQPDKSPSVLPGAAPAQAPAGAATLQFTPATIVVQGGLPDFAEAERHLVDPFVGKRISVAELYEIARRIEADYAERGYPFARVVVPPQHLTDGATARLRVVDGYVEAVDLAKVTRRLRRPIHALLDPLVGKHWLRMAELDRRLSLVNDLPGAKVRSTLARGAQTGGVKLIIEAEDAPVSGSLSYDNRLGPAFRGQETSIQLAINSPTGLGEQIYGFASGDPGMLGRAFSGAADRRVTGAGVFVALGEGVKLNLDETQSVTQPTGGLFVTRDRFDKWAFRLSDPVIRTRAQTLIVTVSLDFLHERQTAPQFEVELFNDRYRIERIGTDYSLRLRTGSFSVSTIVSTAQGNPPNLAPLSRAAARTSFTKFEATGSYVQGLPLGLQSRLLIREQTVFAGGVPNSELFSLDGPQALSAFTTGAISADEGVTGRLEFGRPTPFYGGALVVTPTVYGAGARADYAVHTPYDTTEADAYGLGLEFAVQPPRLGQTIDIALDWGRAVSNGPVQNHTRIGVIATIGF
jgi:hemolysin activation/secretion protein